MSNVNLTVAAPDPATLPHINSGPTLLAVTWSLTAAATVMLGLRLYCKVLGHRSLYWDDWILIAAWAAIIGDVGITQYMVTDYDVGKYGWDLPPDLDWVKFNMVTNARASVIITATVWTKTAFAVTLLRLTEGFTHHFIWFIIVSMNVAMGVSALLPWLLCGKLAPGAPRDGCIHINDLLGVWISTSAYSAAMDFTLAIIPWTFLWRLKMKKKEKIGIAIAMSMGIVAGSVAIVKCTELPNLFTGDYYNQVQLFYWDITEASVTMMATCIPALRVLIRDVKGSSRGYRDSGPSSSFKVQPRRTPPTFNSDTAPISSVDGTQWRQGSNSSNSDRAPWEHGTTFLEMENKSSNSETSMA